MKLFKGKAFFLKTILFHIFLVLIISFVSLNFWENPIYDTIVNSANATVTGSDEISLIVIDDKSLDSYRWPWARSLYGEIFDYLNKTNAKVVVFDSILRSLDKERPASSDNYFFDVVSNTRRKAKITIMNFTKNLPLTYLINVQKITQDTVYTKVLLYSRRLTLTHNNMSAQLTLI